MKFPLPPATAVEQAPLNVHLWVHAASQHLSPVLAHGKLSPA